jgi:hypothetical protein
VAAPWITSRRLNREVLAAFAIRETSSQSLHPNWETSESPVDFVMTHSFGWNGGNRIGATHRAPS